MSNLINFIIMPDFNPTGQITPDKTITQPQVLPDTLNSNVETDIESGTKGLTAEELKDPNEIKVTISDHDAPIVILYGPPSCGKTMTLVCLTRFLKSHGYTVQPERGFRPSADTHYKSICENFNEMVNSDDAATSTNNISFMLVKVYNTQGRCLCQILEAPGEYYFTKDNPKAEYPTYFHEIADSDTRKVWAIIVEPDWEDQEDRVNYVDRIHKLKSRICPRDKVVFVYNKIDCTNFVISPGIVNTSEAIKKVSQDYPGLFSKFENTHPITRFLRKYDCGFIPFQTGNYTPTVGGKLRFTKANDAYARNLWNEIKKQI